MLQAEAICKIKETGAMAIVRVETVERGIEIAQGCLDGGVDVLEISYTNNNAGEVIKALKQKFGSNILVGAGTVLDSETARLAILNGAEFVIAPTFSKEVARLCNRYQVPYGPGCTTYTEMMEALEVGSSFVKAFPISNFYGPKLVDVFTTPVPNLPILASGGVTFDNLGQWIDSGVISVGIGGLLTKGSKEQICENARRIRTIIDEHRDVVKSFA